MKIKQPIVVLLFVLSMVTGAYGVVGASGEEAERTEERKYSRVILKLDVKNIKQLTTNSSKYKALVPGRKFPLTGFHADLDLKNAILKVTDSVLDRLKGMNYRLNHKYSTLPYLALDVSPEVLTLLSTLPGVLDVIEDRSIELVDDCSSPHDVDNPNLVTSMSIIGAENAWRMGYTGDFWYVAILDTGIRRTHQLFQGKTIVEACFSSKGDCPNGETSMFGTGAAAHYDSKYFVYDHGTSVAGIAVGNYEGLAGVAKNSNLIAIQIYSRGSEEECKNYPCRPCLTSTYSDIMKGLEHVYNLRCMYNIAAVNLSLGGGRYSEHCDNLRDDLLKAPIDNLKSVGIATVISVGNGGYCGCINYPACISSAVAVGASDNTDEEFYLNNWHETLVEFFAPSVSINTSIGDSDSSYQPLSGTSGAAPQVAGAWALLKQANFTASVDQVFNALRTTGRQIGSSRCGGGTIPRIQVDEAIRALTSSTPSITVTSPNGSESWSVGGTYTIKWTSSGIVGNVKIEYSTTNGSSWSEVTSSTANDWAYSWTVPAVPSTQCLVRISEATIGTPADTSDAVFSIISSGLPASISLNRTQLYFNAVFCGVKTGDQEIRISNSGGGTLNWLLKVDQAWLGCTPTIGTNGGIITVSVYSKGFPVGTYTGTITISDLNAANSPRTVDVNLTIKETSKDQAPFGTFETLVSGSSVSGSIPVTGWVLDDIGVASVKIFREEISELIYIGDAVFVEGARPDVEQAYPDYPMNYKAGWGYMMLTNLLPNGGNGTFTIHSVATDVGGNQVTLGTNTITCDNANAVKPFGTIDTPTQGGTTSGSSFINWGWVLTPKPNSIPTDGSTINIYVDGVYLGHPTYNIYRSDIATLFPGYANSNGAVGYFCLDTTAYENGVHTIQWVASDNAGNTAGIGSRYFTIQNTGSATSQRRSAAFKLQGVTYNNKLLEISIDNSTPIRIQRGYNRNIDIQNIYPDGNGIIDIEIKELERLEIHFREAPNPARPVISTLSDEEQLFNISPLPIGSTLDTHRNVFYWQPGPGFVGLYSLVFLDKKTARIRKINITVLPFTGGVR